MAIRSVVSILFCQFILGIDGYWSAWQGQSDGWFFCTISPPNADAYISQICVRDSVSGLNEIWVTYNDGTQSETCGDFPLGNDPSCYSVSNGNDCFTSVSGFIRSTGISGVQFITVNGDQSQFWGSASSATSFSIYDGTNCLSAIDTSRQNSMSGMRFYFSPPLTSNPTTKPSSKPTVSPSSNPTKPPSFNPTKSPSLNPTASPTLKSTKTPSSNPTRSPSFDPTTNPTLNPTLSSILTFNPTTQS